jgi:hypothetical protein
VESNSFYIDVFRNVYATSCLQSALGKRCDTQKLDIDSNDFRMLSRNLAISEESVIFAPGDGRVQILDNLDARSLRVIYGTDDEYVADVNGVYRNLNTEVSSVLDPESFRPVPSALELDECIYNPGHGKYYLCDWYQDATTIYYDDQIISGVDIDTFTVVSKFEAKDKNRSYKPN